MTPVTQFVIDWIAAYGWPPSVEEIRKGLGYKSKSTAFARLEEAVAAGEIERGPHPRQIRIVEDR